MSASDALTGVDGKLASMRLVVTGDPVAKGRPRTKIVNNADGRSFAQVYTDPQTRSWEETVGWQVRQQLASWSVDPSVPGEFQLPLAKRIIVTLRFNFERPASLPKREQYPLTKKDVDNLAKSVLDALQTVQLIKDDNKVTDLMVYKRFTEPGHPLGVEIDLTGWL